jgi:hypothetical protein
LEEKRWRRLQEDAHKAPSLNLTGSRLCLSTGHKAMS